MGRIPAFRLLLPLAAAALLFCAAAVQAQTAAGGFQAAPVVAMPGNSGGAAPVSSAVTATTLPPVPQTGAGVGSTLYDAQIGPTAPMYGGSGYAVTAPPPLRYDAQIPPGAQDGGYYNTQMATQPIQSAPQPYYPAQPYPQTQPYAPLSYPLPSYAPPSYAPQSYPAQSFTPAPGSAPAAPAYPQPAMAPYTQNIATPVNYGAPAQNPAQAAAAAPVGAGGYTLGPGDKVKITVFDEPDMTGEYPVDGNGAIRLPLIGSLRAVGLTANGLEAAIVHALSPNYIKQPRVNVEISSYRPVYVVGAVVKPGQYPYVNDMTMLNAVAMAGGFTDEAVQSVVYVRHEGATQEETVDTNVPLLIRPGDTVRVETTLFWQAINMFSPLTSPAAIAATASH